jgi:hypothetical protein
MASLAANGISRLQLASALIKPNGHAVNFLANNFRLLNVASFFQSTIT